MEVKNAIAPNDPSELFKRLGDEPFVMVNLLKFKPEATYTNTNQPPCSGEEAFRRYLDAVRKPLEDKGGRFIKYSEIPGLLIGQVDELWDYILMVEYPSVAAFEKLTSPSDELKKAQVHRLAGLAGQLNIATKGGSLLEGSVLANLE